MKIVCPKCELKGQVDVALAGAKTRIACVRCAATFEAVFNDGEMQVLPPQESPVETLLECAVNAEVTPAPEVELQVVEPQPETPHEIQFNPALQLNAAPAIPEDEFLTSSPDLMRVESVDTSPFMRRELSKEVAGQSVEIHSQEMPGGTLSAGAMAASLTSQAVSNIARPPSDAYGLGVRLMRVSPLWLLIAGLSFIAFIVFCNWLIKPIERTGGVESMIAATDNYATNQSSQRLNTSSSTSQAPVNNQTEQPLTQSGIAFLATEAKEASAPSTAPNVATVEEKPVVEEKKAAPASASNGAGEAKDGKVTVQIGSYNEAAQAEERVVNLKSAGFEARSVAVEIPKRGMWYRVQSGRFVTRDEAERYGKQLRDKGVVSSFITTDVQE